jgi:hypothetical protein
MMHNWDHLGRVTDSLHDNFHRLNAGPSTSDVKPLKHIAVNHCKPAFPKGGVKVVFWMNASATYRDQTPLQGVTDTVSVGGEPLNRSAEEILTELFPRLVQVREYRG